MTSHSSAVYKKAYNDYLVSVCREVFQDNVKEEHYRYAHEIIKGTANDDDVVILPCDGILIFKKILEDIKYRHIDPIGLYKKATEKPAAFPAYQNVVIDALKNLQNQEWTNPFLWGEGNRCPQQSIVPNFGQNTNPDPIRTAPEEELPMDDVNSEIHIPKDQEDKENIEECVELISDKILSDFLITNSIKYQLVEGMEIRCNERKHRYYVIREIATNTHFLKYTENPEIDMENDTVLFTDSNPDMVKDVFDKLIWKLGDYKQLALYSIV